MNDERPDPDELLKAVNLQENKNRRGRLKIFLGMSAGVGKTYAMLEAAHKLSKNNVNVVIGTINTHGREDTKHLLEGLIIIPEKWIEYKDSVFEELDIDEILRLKPQLILIDELAHSNVPGSRHPKRWQDVNEILENGIDVYTTLNVQHIESLKEVIESVTEISIRESVPDSIIESAESIELIDITPDELLQRLKEGKVYYPDQTQIAIQHFFQPDRLTALREIVLRYAANKIGHDLHGMISRIGRSNEWKLHEQLLVAVSCSPNSQKLIRAARRMAFNLDVPWVAVYVNTGVELDELEKGLLAKHLSLARDLGAEVITTNDPNVAEAIQRIAHQKGVTQIIVGRSPRKPFFGFFERLIADKLAKECRDIDIHIIRQEPYAKYHKKYKKGLLAQDLFSYLSVLVLVILLSGINWLLLPLIGYRIIGFIFLGGILLLSIFFKKGPIFFGSALSFFIWDYFFIPPFSTFATGTIEDTILLVLYLLTAIITGLLTDRTRMHKDMLAKREESILVLYDIIHKIASARSSKQLINSIKARLDIILHGSCEILVKHFANGLNLEEMSDLFEDEQEKNTAIWAFKHGKEAGWSTTTLSSAKNLYIPLKGFDEIVGLLSYKPKISNQELTIEEKNLLHTVIQQLSNYLERSLTEERKRHEEQIQQIDKVRQNILRLISEEFAQPFLAFKEVINKINEESLSEKKIELKKLDELEDFSKEINQSLLNISFLTRFSEGLIAVDREQCDIKEIINVCLINIKKYFDTHIIKTLIPKTLPAITCDFSMIELLIYNLVFNAAEYSPPGSTIEVAVKVQDAYLVLSISDEGTGIPQDQLEVIFESFYRLPGTTARGIGLGLALAKKIAEIHNGHLKAENNKRGGAKFSLFLPIEPNNKAKHTIHIEK